MHHEHPKGGSVFDFHLCEITFFFNKLPSLKSRYFAGINCVVSQNGANLTEAAGGGV